MITYTAVSRRHRIRGAERKHRATGGQWPGRESGRRSHGARECHATVPLEKDAAVSHGTRTYGTTQQVRTWGFIPQQEGDAPTTARTPVSTPALCKMTPDWKQAGGFNRGMVERTAVHPSRGISPHTARHEPPTPAKPAPTPLLHRRKHSVRRCRIHLQTSWLGSPRTERHRRGPAIKGNGKDGSGEAHVLHLVCIHTNVLATTLYGIFPRHDRVV